MNATDIPTTTTGSQFPEHERVYKASKFVSFYSTADEPTSYMRVEHRSEAAARKGSWQSAAMRAAWIYRGYRAL